MDEKMMPANFYDRLETSVSPLESEVEFPLQLDWHPERSSTGLEASEASVVLGGLTRLRYRSSDWLIRATELRPQLEVPVDSSVT